MSPAPRHSLKLFDDFERTDMEYASRTEEGFPFWNRSAQPEFAQMRAELEAWFSRYDPADAPRLRREFRSKREPQHVGALFELFIHEHLLRAGFEVKCQIDLPGTPNKPDFLALHNGVPAFYVEATARLESERDAATERRYQEVIEAIRDLRAPDFFVHVIVDGALSRSVNKRTLRRDLEAWLAGLDHDAEVERLSNQALAEPATFEWEREGLSLTFEATPRFDSRGFDFGDFLTTEIRCARFWKPDAALADAIDEKATRYGTLELPYVVAVALRNATTTWSDVTPALKASWGAIARPRNTGVSGALLAFVPNIVGAVAMKPLMIPNPTASRPLGPHASAFVPFAGSLWVRATTEIT